MKKYIVPQLVCVDLRAEERVCDCEYKTGLCEEGWWEGLQS